jgi:protein SCO1
MFCINSCLQKRIYMPLFIGLFLLSASIQINASTTANNVNETFDFNKALKLSQSAIGKKLGKYKLADKNGNPISFADLRGKPLVISLIYTSCYHTCPMTSQNLSRVVQIARAALGHDSFNVATIGFDTQIDTSERMKHFAKEQRISHINNWYFLSLNEKSRDQLIKDLGFIYFASPRGFDHVVQATIIDEKSVVYRQVYGEVFDTPLLVEPLKELVLGEKKEQPLLEELVNKVRFFCTTYDPSTDSYHFDYSIFVGMFIGAAIILLGFFFLLRELRNKQKMKTHS